MPNIPYNKKMIKLEDLQFGCSAVYFIWRQNFFPRKQIKSLGYSILSLVVWAHLQSIHCTCRYIQSISGKIITPCRDFPCLFSVYSKHKNYNYKADLCQQNRRPPICLCAVVCRCTVYVLYKCTHCYFCGKNGR